MSKRAHRKHTILKIIATALGASIFATIGLISFFADNIRALFGASADGLAGNEDRVAVYSRSMLEGHKNLQDFFPAGEGGEREAAAASSGDRHTDHGINGVFETAQDPFSTFAVDVDTASYTFARRAIHEGRLPVPASVRVEEFVNAFSYDYRPPQKAPFSVSVDGMPSPFDPDRVFLRVGLQGRRIERGARKPARLVFLVDVSGSMNSPDKLGLAKEALKILTRNLERRDEVALVTYAGNTALVLEPTSAGEVDTIEEAIDSLSSGGGTAMNSGLETAYALARRGLRRQTVSRVIVLSDGDANVGPASTPDLLATIAKGAEEGVTLTTVGFGRGNYNDAAMERLADEGNGQSVYIDSLKEARKVFQEQLEGTLEVIAKDAKIQVEFDPAKVERYRLVGYENRDIADEDFRNDRKDAGEIGAGHSVTAVYELQLADTVRAGDEGALGLARVRAKTPEAGVGDPAQAWSFAMNNRSIVPSVGRASDDLRFAVGVAALAEKLRGSPFAVAWPIDEVVSLGCDLKDQREERLDYCKVARKASALMHDAS